MILSIFSEQNDPMILWSSAFRDAEITLHFLSSMELSIF